MADQNSIQTIISIEGAHRLPTTYDKYPSQSHLSIHPQNLFNQLNRPWIDMSRPPMASNDLQ